MRKLDLDAMLGDRSPCATFHDSELEAIAIDFVGAVAHLHFAIQTDLDDGVPMNRGVLELQKLHAFSAETPRVPRDKSRRGGLWITAEGPLPDPGIGIELKLPTALPDEAFGHYLFASDTNSFILFAAEIAIFTWEQDTSALQRILGRSPW